MSWCRVVMASFGDCAIPVTTARQFVTCKKVPRILEWTAHVAMLSLGSWWYDLAGALYCTAHQAKKVLHIRPRHIPNFTHFRLYVCWRSEAYFVQSGRKGCSTGRHSWRLLGLLFSDQCWCAHQWRLALMVSLLLSNSYKPFTLWLCWLPGVSTLARH